MNKYLTNKIFFQRLKVFLNQLVYTVYVPCEKNNGADKK